MEENVLSTYSQNEVDHLLQIQAENIAANFLGKITSQQKFVQETIAAHETEMRKVSAELYTEMEKFNTSAAKSAESHTERMRLLIDRTQNDMDVQFEQVKADLDRTLMNDLKGFDKRLQKLELQMQNISESNQSSSSQTVTILVALSVVASLANLVLLFVHH